MIKRPVVVLYLSLVLMYTFSAFAAPSVQSIRQPSPEEKTAFKLAAEKGDVAAIKAVLDKGIAVDAPLTNDGDSTLLLAVTSGKIDAVKLVLDRGANPSRSNNKGIVPIAVAAGQNQPRILALLLSRGALPNASIASPPEFEKRSAKYSILADAAYRGNEEVFDLLLRYGPTINRPGFNTAVTELEAAVLAGRTTFVERLLRSGALVSPDLLDEARQKQVDRYIIEMLENNCPWSTEKFKARDKKLRAFWDEGNKALVAGRLEEARRLFEQGRAVVANNAPGFVRLLGETYARAGDESRAYDHFARFLEINPPADKALEVRKRLLGMERGKNALVSDQPPPWVVRYQCSGEDIDECKKQCEGGHPGSCGTLGILYKKMGPKGGPDKVIKYLKTACEGGRGVACRLTGDLYYEGGQVVKQSRKDAAGYYFFGCQLQDGDSCLWQSELLLSGYRSTKMFGGTKEYTEQSAIAYAVDLYRMLCDLENAKACFMLGSIYYESTLMPLDIPKALQALEFSCGKGVARACSYLAKIYTEDNGVPPDPAKAADYQAKACAAGECCKDCN